MLTTIFIGSGIALLWSLFSATYFKRRIIPLLGVFGILAITLFIVLTMEYGIAEWVKGWGIYAFLGFLVLNYAWVPCIFQAIVRKAYWRPHWLILSNLGYSLYTFAICYQDFWGGEFRLGFSLTTLAFAIFGGLMAVRDEFSKLWCWLTPVLSALVAYLPIAVCVFFASRFEISMGKAHLFILTEMVLYIALSWVVTAAAKIIKNRKLTTS